MTGLTVTIEPASAEDVVAVQELFYRCWLANYPNAEHGVTSEDIERGFADRHSKQKLAKQRGLLNAQDDEITLVAKVGTDVLGVSEATRHPEGSELKALYVLTDVQRRGIGSRLWQETLAWMLPSEKVTLTVVTYNHRAKAFYRKQGFENTGRRLSQFVMQASGVLLPEMEMTWTP